MGSTAVLTAWLGQTFNIPVDEDHLLVHYEFDDATRRDCPGGDRAGWLRYEEAVTVSLASAARPTRADAFEGGGRGRVAGWSHRAHRRRPVTKVLRANRADVPVV